LNAYTLKVSQKLDKLIVQELKCQLRKEPNDGLKREIEQGKEELYKAMKGGELNYGEV
jgi:hypothetical protein